MVLLNASGMNFEVFFIDELRVSEPPEKIEKLRHKPINVHVLCVFDDKESVNCGKLPSNVHSVIVLHIVFRSLKHKLEIFETQFKEHFQRVLRIDNRH